MISPCVAKGHPRYCCEDLSLVENYELAVADTEKWELHHRYETHTPNGEKLETQVSKKQLIAKNQYYNRPAKELIFLKQSEHRKVHFTGNQWAKGKNIGNKNALGNHLSAETRQKMGDSRKGNINNGCVYIKCIETGAIHRVREWIFLGFRNVYMAAKGIQKTCGGFHFEYVQNETT